MNREIIRQFVREALVSASSQYVNKEAVRESIQQLVMQQISDGKIASQADLDEFFKTVDMAVRALKGVPFDVFKKMA